DDPARVTLERYRDFFGRTSSIVVLVRVPDRLGDPDFLARLDALHEALETRTPFLRRITSLINIRHTAAEGDGLVVDPLLGEEVPASPAEIDAFLTRLHSNPLYRNLVVSDDERWTLISIETDLLTSESLETAAVREDVAADDWGGFEEVGDDDFAGDVDDFGGFETAPAAANALRKVGPEEDALILARVREVVDEFEAAGLDLHLSGGIAIGEEVRSRIQRDFTRLMAAAFVLIGLLFVAAFRRPSGALLVLGVVGLSLGSTVGTMAALDAPIGFGTQVLPSFLIAVGVGYAVHIVTLFWYHYPLLRDRRTAVLVALEHSGRPIVLTGLTTIGGLLSFIPVELAPIAQIGVFAPVGVFLSMVFSLSALPALLILLPLEPGVRTPNGTSAERAMVALGTWASRHPRRVLAGTALLLGLSMLGIARIDIRHDPLSWLPESHPLREATQLVDQQMGGANTIEVFVQARDGQSFRSPELLQRVDEWEAAVEDLSTGPLQASKVLGLHGIVKELNQAIEGGSTEAYTVPEGQSLVAQELLLFENSGSDDMEQWVDSSYANGRLSVRIGWADSFFVAPYASRIVELAETTFGDLADVQQSGLGAIVDKTFVSVIDSLRTSYGIALVVISALLVLMVGDVRVGLVSVLPNLAPIIGALGLMGWLGVPLGVYTLLVGSIALGLAVDDTIHFAHSFVRYEQETGDPHDAIRRTLATAGVALLFSSVALVAGFAVFSLASLSALLHFGLIASAAIALALLSDLIVLPAMLAWLRRGAAPSRGTVEVAPLDAIVDQLDRIEPARARFLAAFAYVLARVAHADDHIDETETEAIRKSVRELGALEEADAGLVVRLATAQARILSTAESAVVSASFLALSNETERDGLMRCLARVAQADGSFAETERREIARIGAELGYSEADLSRLEVA
ncbi:MAG: MMPL family transporter, partial [Myxococcota bacterium]